MKISRQVIENEISIRKVYVPPMIFFEDIEEKEEILAGSISGGGPDTETGDDGDDDPSRGKRGRLSSFYDDPVTLEDFTLDVENYQ